MILKTSKVNLFYEKTGAGEPIILLHGNGEDHTIFNNSVASLKNHFTVYAVDTRGHGNSSPILEFHYEEMAEDIYEFICRLNLYKPIIYGFSDGGIMALLLSIKYPDLLSKIIISGANTYPNGLKPFWVIFFRLIYFFSKSEKLKLMLNEPDISEEMLHKIKIPVFITAGSKDMVRLEHIQTISDTITGSKLTVFEGETHDSYVVGSTKIADHILNICKDE